MHKAIGRKPSKTREEYRLIVPFAYHLQSRLNELFQTPDITSTILTLLSIV
jgi:hypothetical protein